MTLARRRDARDYASREVAPEEAGPVRKQEVRIAAAAETLAPVSAPERRPVSIW